MCTNYQDRVDTYLRGEMDNESLKQFKKELISNESLARVYRQTKAIADVIADRKEKLNMMARWDKEEEIKSKSIHTGAHAWRWTIGVSVAACIVVGFFVFRPILMPTSPLTSSDFAMPNLGNDIYYRGSESSMRLLDSLINIKDYAKALGSVDSMISNYENVLRQYERKDSLTEKEEYEMMAYHVNLEELNWRRANILIFLGKTDKAKECLKSMVEGRGNYQEHADSLLKTLNN